MAHFWLAAELAHTGRLTEAQAAAQAGLALRPSFTIARNRAGAPSATIRSISLSVSVLSRGCARPGCRRDERYQAASSSSNAFASFRSSVSKPSVNQPSEKIAGLIPFPLVAPEPSHGSMNFGCTPLGGTMSKREPQTILKTDERAIRLELGCEGNSPPNQAVGTSSTRYCAIGTAAKM
jgi:hypothetical protein